MKILWYTFWILFYIFIQFLWIIWILYWNFLFSFTFIFLGFIFLYLLFSSEEKEEVSKKEYLSLKWKENLKKLRELSKSRHNFRIYPYSLGKVNWYVTSEKWKEKHIYISITALNRLRYNALKALYLHEEGHLINKDNSRLVAFIWTFLNVFSLWILWNLYSRYHELKADQYSIKEWKLHWFRDLSYWYVEERYNFTKKVNSKTPLIFNNSYFWRKLFWSTHPSEKTRLHFDWKIKFSHYLSFFL